MKKTDGTQEVRAETVESLTEAECARRLDETFDRLAGTYARGPLKVDVTPAPDPMVNPKEVVAVGVVTDVTFTGEEVPALVRLKRLIDTRAIHDGHQFSEIWLELMQFHGQRGLLVPNSVLIEFNDIVQLSRKCRKGLDH